MHHAEFRRLFGADPRRSDREALAHRVACAECGKYAHDLERVDALVRGALEVPGPKPALPPWEIEKQRRFASPARRYALASVLVALALGAGVWWTGQERARLIVEVVKHVDRERDVLVPGEERVDEAKVRRTFAAGGATLLTDLPFSTARTCTIRGNVVPHFVLQTRDGAVAVLLLSKERFLMSHDFVAQGYEGTLLPKGSHSIAVVGTSKGAVEQGAALVGAGIEWPNLPPAVPPAEPEAKPPETAGGEEPP